MNLRVASSERGRTARSTAHPEGGTATAEPAGIWHGYAPESRRTLCGRPLVETHTWPTLSWPTHAPPGHVCYSCELVARHATG